MVRSVARSKKPHVSVVTSVVASVAALYFAQAFLIPLALAALLSFLLAPLATHLERWKLGRVASVLIVVAIASGVIFSLGWLVMTQIVSLADNLPKYQDEIVHKVQGLRGHTGGVGENIKRLSQELEKATTTTTSAPTSSPASSLEGAIEETAEHIRQETVAGAVEEKNNSIVTTAPTTLGSSPSNPVFTTPVPVSMTPLKVLGSYIGLALGPLGTSALVVLFVIFMLLERDALRKRIISLVSPAKASLTSKALDDAAVRISRYMGALSIINGTYGLAIAGGLWLIGQFLGHGTPFPSFLLWGLLCAVLRFIPYVGPWAAAAFPIALAFAVYQGFTVFIATAVLFIVIELLSNNVMEPWIYGDRTGMSALAILVAAAFWTWLWGPVGLLLSTPLTVCIVVTGKYVPELSFLYKLLGDQPVEPHSDH